MYTVKRPLAIIGYTCFIASSVALSISKGYLSILLISFVCFALLHYFTKKVYTKHILLSLFIFIISVFYTHIFTANYTNDIQAFEEKTGAYTGYVEKINNSSKNSYTIKLVDTNNGFKEIFSVKIFYADILAVADVVEIKGKITPLKSDIYIINSYANGIKANLSVLEIKKSDVSIKTLSYKFLLLKEKILSKADGLYSVESQPIVYSMGYSDKSHLSHDTKDLFISGGISHTLVVSGFHILIILSSIKIFFDFFRINKKIKNLLIAGVLVLFMLLIGFTHSIIRAGSAALVALVLTNFKKEYDSITILGLIMLITAISNPYATRDIGVMLSYAACSGIICSNKLLKNKDNTYQNNRKRQSGYETIKKSVYPSLFAVLFTMPILSLAGMQITLLSPIYNLLAFPLVGVICTLSFFTPLIACFGAVGTIINFVLVPINSVMIKMLILALKIIQKYLDFTLINLSDEIFLVVFLAIIIAILIAFLQFKKGKTQQIFVLAVSLLTFLCYNFQDNNKITLTVFDSGREASFIIKSKKENVLILSEKITFSKYKNQLSKLNSNRFDKIYICTKKDEDFFFLQDKTPAPIKISETQVVKGQDFVLSSSISAKEKSYIIQVLDMKLAFGHGKVSFSSSDNIDIYILGNDKPQDINAENIFIFGNTPKYLKIENITEISADLKIKINKKTGEYKIIRDVYNFGY